MRPGRERGYAIIAAIVGVAAFGFIAFELLAQNRGVLAEVRGEAEHARLLAACDAGLYAAIAGLGTSDASQQWAIDGSPRLTQFNGIALKITVEDERGKIPLNGIIEEEVHQVFQLAGVPQSQVSALTDAYEDWQDTDSSARPAGAEAPAYATLGYKPRNSGFHTIGELRMLRGMTDAIYNQVAPAVTVFFGESGGFSESTAQVLALEVLGEETPNSPAVIARQKVLSGQSDTSSPSFQSVKPQQKVNLVGRTLTVKVEASVHGAYMKRSGIIELTGNKSDPYWFRYLD